MKTVIVLIIALLGVACNEAPHQTINEEGKELPHNVSELTAKGSGWVYFKLEGECFLYHRSGSFLSNNLDRVMVKVDCK